MAKLWENKLHKSLDKDADDFNRSIEIDSVMVMEDIDASVAHVRMLSECDIISKEDFDLILGGLNNIKNEISSNTLDVDMTAEDIHTFIEQELVKRIGDVGKKLHTARSRNDQVITDLRLYTKNKSKYIISLINDLLLLVCDMASTNKDAVMPGYTHLRKAQPITFAHYIMAYAMMFQRDSDRINDCIKRIDFSPLGSAALAGTTFPIDRNLSAKYLGMSNITQNSIDGVSDRDFVIELSSNFSILMMHMSRLSEEMILYSTDEFGFIEITDEFSTGSSIMPQKRNPDIAELIRGKVARVYGSQMALLTLLKSLPLSYNKDLQEDKELIFDSIDTVIDCLKLLKNMLSKIKINKSNMKKACQSGFINATDMADYLTKKGIPFRDAYAITGDIVAYCIQNNKTLEDVSLDEYKKFSDAFDKDIFEEIKIETCVNKRKSAGGCALENIDTQIKWIKDNLISFE